MCSYHGAFKKETMPNAAVAGSNHAGLDHEFSSQRELGADYRQCMNKGSPHECRDYQI
jgi:hypothetical protein